MPQTGRCPNLICSPDGFRIPSGRPSLSLLSLLLSLLLFLPRLPPGLAGILRFYAVAVEHLEILLPESGFGVGHGLVVVVQVEPGGIPVEIGTDERDLRREITSLDRGHVGHRVEEGMCRGRGRFVGASRGDLFGEEPAVILREPGQRGHVELIGGRGGRGVEEAFAPVVDQVLAVVRTVEHCRGGTL